MINISLITKRLYSPKQNACPSCCLFFANHSGMSLQYVLAQRANAEGQGCDSHWFGSGKSSSGVVRLTVLYHEPHAWQAVRALSQVKILCAYNCRSRGPNEPTLVASTRHLQRSQKYWLSPESLSVCVWFLRASSTELLSITDRLTSWNSSYRV